jgi:tetratricopeptide (TPR) repeat protein
LEHCHSFFPNDGSLADDFFPSLRKVGLIKEHDAWFEISWQKIQAAIERYPQSDNTRNTAGWIASRANRRLDEAEAHQREALTLNPDQPAYLDTLAEIHFAKGDRKQALSESKRAINFEPDDEILREQYFRFLDGPFPDR